MTLSGLPHSEIRVSRLTCSSARLFAAYRVLLRLGTPRHPPYALRSLTIRRGRSFRAWRCRASFFPRRRSSATTPRKKRNAPSQTRKSRSLTTYDFAIRYIVFRCLCLNPKMSVKTSTVHTVSCVLDDFLDTFRFFCVVFKEQD